MRAGKFFFRPEYFCEVIAVESAFERLKQMPLYEIMPVFFLVLKADGTVVHMNATMLNALGYDLSEVRGRDSLSLLLPAAERDHVQKAYDKLRAQPGMQITADKERRYTSRRMARNWVVR